MKRMIGFLFGLALALPGCIESSSPLVPATREAGPIAVGLYRGGTAEHSAMNDDVSIALMPNGDYFAVKIVSASDGTKTTTRYSLRFWELDEHHFMVQTREMKSTTTPYIYVLAHVVGPDVKFYAARCDMLTVAPRILAAYKFTVVRRSSWPSCGATSLADLVAFMREVPLRIEKFSELTYIITR